MLWPCVVVVKTISTQQSQGWRSHGKELEGLDVHSINYYDDTATDSGALTRTPPLPWRKQRLGC